jgi:hypothetical protein
LRSNVGRTGEVRALLSQLEAMVDPPITNMVLAYAALDDERVFEWLHRAIDHRINAIVIGLRLSPYFARLREDPRWDEVMTQLEAEEAKGSAGQTANREVSLWSEVAISLHCTTMSTFRVPDLGGPTRSPINGRSRTDFCCVRQKSDARTAINSWRSARNGRRGRSVSLLLIPVGGWKRLRMAQVVI